MFTKADRIALEYHNSPMVTFKVLADKTVLRKVGDVTYSNDDSYEVLCGACFKNGDLLGILESSSSSGQDATFSG